MTDEDEPPCLLCGHVDDEVDIEDPTVPFGVATGKMICHSESRCVERMTDQARAEGPPHHDC